jgi:hypothetical protein
MCGLPYPHGDGWWGVGGRPHDVCRGSVSVGTSIFHFLNVGNILVFVEFMGINIGNLIF